MSLPNDVNRGEFLKADWLNQVKAEVKKNEIISSKGLSFNRSTGGTTLTSSRVFGTIPFKGEIVTAVNNTTSDMAQWWWAGIDGTTTLDEAVYKGADIIIRKPEYTDLYNRLVMLAEPIPYGGVGKAYISSDMMITRVQFEEDEDDFEYASVDPEGDEGSEDAHLLRANQIGPVRIIQRGDVVTGNWHWCIVRFPVSDIIIPRYVTATSNAVDGLVNVKRTDSVGDLVGEDIEVYDGGIE